MQPFKPFKSTTFNKKKNMNKILLNLCRIIIAMICMLKRCMYRQQPNVEVHEKLQVKSGFKQ